MHGAEAHQSSEAALGRATWPWQSAEASEVISSVGAFGWGPFLLRLGLADDPERGG